MQNNRTCLHLKFILAVWQSTTFFIKLRLHGAFSFLGYESSGLSLVLGVKTEMQNKSLLIWASEKKLYLKDASCVPEQLFKGLSSSYPTWF